MATSDSEGGSGRMPEKVVVLALLVYAAVIAFVNLRQRKSAVQALLSKLRLCWWRPRKMTDEEAARERRIMAEYETRRVERARTFLVAGNIINFFMGAVVLNGVMSHYEVKPIAVFLVSTGHFVSSTMALFASRLTQRGLDASYCVAVLLMVGTMLTNGNSVTIMERSRLFVLFQLLYWSTANPKPWLNSLAFLCIAMTEMALLSMAGHNELAVYPLAAYTCGAAWMCGVDYILKRSVRMEIMAADSENELEAINILLDSICDVILKLDSGLRLKGHSPKLADLLLIRNPDKTLEGEDLRTYMPTDRDRAVFTEHVQGSLAASAHASVFHTKMRDCASSNIDVEFFSVGFRGRDGGQHHILGIREFTDIRPMLPPQGLPTPPPGTATVLDVKDARGAPRAQQRGGIAGHPSSWPAGPAEPLPLAGVAPLPPGLPLGELQPPRRHRDRGESRVGLGTPAALEQSDIRSHSSSSAGRPRSDPGDHAASGSARGGARRETLECAMLLSLTYVMTGWALKMPKGACCPLHSALLHLESVLLPKLKAGPCREDFGTHSEWQCPRCGIQGDEHCDPKHRSRCLLCKAISDPIIQQNSTERSRGKVAM